MFLSSSDYTSAGISGDLANRIYHSLSWSDFTLKELKQIVIYLKKHPDWRKSRSLLKLSGTQTQLIDSLTSAIEYQVKNRPGTQNWHWFSCHECECIEKPGKPGSYWTLFPVELLGFDPEIIDAYNRNGDRFPQLYYYCIKHTKNNHQQNAIGVKRNTTLQSLNITMDQINSQSSIITTANTVNTSNKTTTNISNTTTAAVAVATSTQFPLSMIDPNFKTPLLSAIRYYHNAPNPHKQQQLYIPHKPTSIQHSTHSRDQHQHIPATTDYINCQLPPEKVINQTRVQSRLPNNNDSIEIGRLLASLEFHQYRSPYFSVVVKHAVLLIPNLLGTCVRGTDSFVFHNDLLQQFKWSNSSSDLPSNEQLSVHLRLFSSDTMQHTVFDRELARIRLNGKNIVIPAARKLSVGHKKGLELVRPINITDSMQITNTIAIEINRDINNATKLFRGIAVVEVVRTRVTNDLINSIRIRAAAEELRHQRRQEPTIIINTTTSTTNNNNNNNNNTVNTTITGITQSELLSDLYKPKYCAICRGNAKLMRCSRCHFEWYCDVLHQRRHWFEHRSVCREPTLAMVKAREEAQAAIDELITRASSTVKSSTRTRLTIPISVKHAGGGTSDSDDDDDITEIDTIVSLNDSISIERIELAAKGRHCSHLACFDVKTFLEFSEQSGIWQCPICYKPLPFGDIIVDKAMNTILKEIPFAEEDCDQIRVLVDGTYLPILKVAKNQIQRPAVKRRKLNNESSINTNINVVTNNTPTSISTSISVATTAVKIMSNINNDLVSTSIVNSY